MNFMGTARARRIWTWRLPVFLLLLMTLTKTVVSHKPETLPNEYVQEFSCGKLYYRTLHLDSKTDALYIGAMDKIFRLNLSRISNSNCHKDSLNIKSSNPNTCINEGKSDEFDCRNHIKVIQPVGDGKRLYICGTNAYSPKDWMIYNNLTHLSHNEYKQGSGIGKCPYDPADNSTAILVENDDPKNLPALFSGVNGDFVRSDASIFRTFLNNPITGQGSNNFQRTPKYDWNFLNKPNFVGSFEIGPYVFFFFRETASENIDCDEKVISRVARVCKSDTGGKSPLKENWVTYRKARLNCSIPGESPFYFNEIQSIYKVPGDDTRFYGIFTTPTNGMMGSAICSFHINAIQKVFSGEFRTRTTCGSAYVEELRDTYNDMREPSGYEQCDRDTQSIPVAHLFAIRDHPLMKSSISQENEKAIFFNRDILFTRLVVDRIWVNVYRKDWNFNVYYAGSNDGRVYKIVQWIDDNGKSHSNVLAVFEVTPGEPIRGMEISQKHKALYVSSDHRIKQIDLVMCSRRYDHCLKCVQDPYCGWNAYENTCQPYQIGFLQDVTNEISRICDRSVKKLQFFVERGRLAHLSCFAEKPEALANQEVRWYRYISEEVRYQIRYNYEAGTGQFIETSTKDLVIADVDDPNAGRYDCWLNGALLCSCNVTVTSSDNETSANLGQSSSHSKE